MAKQKSVSSKRVLARVLALWQESMHITSNVFFGSGRSSGKKINKLRLKRKIFCVSVVNRGAAVELQLLDALRSDAENFTVPSV